MNKREFEQLISASNQVASQAYNKLGLLCKKFTKAYADESGDLADEKYFIMAELAEKVDGQLKLDNEKNPIVLDSNTKELSSRLKKWGNEEISFELNKHSVYSPNLAEVKESKLFLVSPVLYDLLNGYIFGINEEDYLEILDKYAERA